MRQIRIYLLRRRYKMFQKNRTQQIFLTKNLDVMMKNIIDSDFDGRPKISVYDIKTGAAYNMKGNSPGWAASIIKFPIMVAAMSEVSQGSLMLEERLAVNHRYTLEPYDTISLLPQGERVPIPELICEMIVNSDNEATNMIADRIGVPKINGFMWHMGMDKTMLGHLLCPRVRRYTSDFNRDGSNITTPDDMVTAIRQVYDDEFSSLDKNTRILSDYLFTFTERDGLKYKIGYISDPIDGSDSHEIGIIEDRLIYAIMINRIGQDSISKFRKRQADNESMNGLVCPEEDDFNEEYTSGMIGFSHRNYNSPVNTYAEKYPHIITQGIRNAYPINISQDSAYPDRQYTLRRLFPERDDKDMIGRILAGEWKNNAKNTYIKTLSAGTIHNMVKSILRTSLYL